ncbi:hypothetical protein GQ53DRAFT_835749 [Thozetella sp. PMI_491]|nr:hypothetical protein GQ53DRAFT_835749 [Thozetella sp. PMI_491]
MSTGHDNLAGDFPANVSVPRRSRQEWERHRALIAMLYIDEGRTLKDVMEYMKAHHNFVGTRRMFVRKLEDWKLDYKHVRKTIAVDAFRQEMNATTSTSLMVQGRPFSVEQIQKYRRRKIEDLCRERARQRMSVNYLSRFIRNPSTLYAIEGLTSAVSEYVDGSFEAGTWSTSTLGGYLLSTKPQKQTTTEGILSIIFTGLLMLTACQRTVQAGGYQYIHAAFALLPGYIESEEPEFLIRLLIVRHSFERRNTLEMWQMLLRHVHELSQVIRGPRHPITRITLAFLTTPMHDHAEAQTRLADTWYSALYKHLMPNNIRACLTLGIELVSSLDGCRREGDQIRLLEQMLAIPGAAYQTKSFGRIIQQLVELGQMERANKALKTDQQRAAMVNIGILELERLRRLGLRELRKGSREKGYQLLYERFRKSEERHGLLAPLTIDSLREYCEYAKNDDGAKALLEERYHSLLQKVQKLSLD